jgi:hypothetical protein
LKKVPTLQEFIKKTRGLKIGAGNAPFQTKPFSKHEDEHILNQIKNNLFSFLIHLSSRVQSS